MMMMKKKIAAPRPLKRSQAALPSAASVVLHKFDLTQQPALSNHRQRHSHSHSHRHHFQELQRSAEEEEEEEEVVVVKEECLMRYNCNAVSKIEQLRGGRARSVHGAEEEEEDMEGTCELQRIFHSGLYTPGPQSSSNDQDDEAAEEEERDYNKFSLDNSISFGVEEVGLYYMSEQATFSFFSPSRPFPVLVPVLCPSPDGGRGGGGGGFA